MYEKYIQPTIWTTDELVLAGTILWFYTGGYPAIIVEGCAQIPGPVWAIRYACRCVIFIQGLNWNVPKMSAK